MIDQPTADELSLRDYIAILQRHKLIAISVFFLPIIAALVWTLLTPAVYESQATVVLRTNNNQQLFPSVGSSQRSQFVRQPAAELEYTRSTVFSSQASERVPGDASVQVIYDAGDQNRSSELRFRARSGEQATARNAADAWAQYYVTARSQNDIDEVAATIEGLEAQIEQLEVEKDELLAPIKPIDDALLTETDSDTISRLTTQRLSLRQSLEDDLLPVTIQLRTLSQDLSTLRIATGYVSRPDNSARISVEAGPARKVAPRMDRNLALAAVLGALAAAGAVLVRENYRGVVNSPADVEALAPGIPILARVPAFPKGHGDPRLLAAQAGTTYAQSLERIISSLLYRHTISGDVRTSVLFTSAIPGEGKTTVVSHVAQRIGATDTPSIVIDADLRRPDLHLSLGIKQKVPGLSHLLLSREPLARHLVRLRSAPNVRVLTAGAATDDAASLLRQSFEESIETLPADHDLLLIDAPPVLAVTDAEIMSRSVDGVVVVVRPGKTTKSQFSETVQKLTSAQANIVGIVVVAAKLATGSYADTYYYYETDQTTASLRDYRPPAKAAAHAGQANGAATTVAAARSAQDQQARGPRPTQKSQRRPDQQPTKASSTTRARSEEAGQASKRRRRSATDDAFDDGSPGPNKRTDRNRSKKPQSKRSQPSPDAKAAKRKAESKPRSDSTFSWADPVDLPDS